MKQLTGLFIIIGFAVVFSLMWTSCDDDKSDPISPEPHYAEVNWDDADMIRGGLLYDKWWKINNAEEPTEDFAPWQSQDSNTRSGSTTWRCKECHGWDYQGKDGAYGSGSHFTGFDGVWASKENSKGAIFDAVKGSNTDHELSTVLSDTDILDLTKFIVDGLLDMRTYVDYETKAALGNADDGQSLYAANCASCHGDDGSQINFGDDAEPVYMNDLALGNPWETLHKIRYGQPDTNMPSMVEEGLTDAQQSDVLAYCQSLEPVHYADENWENANLARGGLLYDKWWKINDGAEPTEDFNPIWSTQDSNTRSGPDTWRCKECHGWDYNGKDGAYATGGHFTGFDGVWAAKENPKGDIFDAIKASGADHDLSGVLSDEDVLDLTKFVVDGMVDMRQYIDYDTKAGLGSADNGQPLYAANCASCHGEDGTQINFGDDENPKYVFDVALENPWETLHKITYGHPGSAMQGTIGAELTAENNSDILAYTQGLAE